MTVSLAYDDYGSGPPLLILHGLMGQARNWATQAKLFAKDYRVLAVDLRNHGRSPWASGMTYEEMAEDVAALIEHAGAPVKIIGHSMGGKVTMVTALKYPDLIEKAVVVDISAVKHTDSPFYGYFEAMLGLDLSSIKRRGEADRQLQAALPDPAERAFLLLNLAAGEDGGLAWKPNLAELYACLPDILDWPEHLFGYQNSGPALFVAGGKSPYIKESHKPDIARLFPAAQHVVIPDAGHWVHAEQPKAFYEAVSGFLRD